MISIVILYFWLALLLFSVGFIAGLADQELVEKKQHNKNIKTGKPLYV
jgi:hypothetical protein